MIEFLLSLSRHPSTIKRYICIYIYILFGPMKKISSTVSSNCVRRVALIGFIDTLTVYCLGTIVKKVEEGIGFLQKKNLKFERIDPAKRRVTMDKKERKK